MGTKSLPNRGYVYPERDFLDEDAGPDLLNQLFLRAQLAGRPDKQGDYIEGAPAEGHMRSVQPHLPAGKVNFPPRIGVYGSLAPIRHHFGRYSCHRRLDSAL